MCSCRSVVILVIACSVGVSPKTYASNEKNNGKSVLDKVVRECLESESRLSCFSDKAALALERSMNWNIPITEEISIFRNKEVINKRSSKSLKGFKRLTTALSNFLDSHTISIDLTKSQGKQGRSLGNDDVDTDERTGGGGGGGSSGDMGDGIGSSGIFNVNKQALKQEKKYYQYAFMVLLGIFGLTGPIMMKILGVMAAHALLASKAALIIVGGVALKKIFEQNNSKPKIKVHTIPAHDSEEHEYDRIGHVFNYNYIPHRPYSSFTSVGSSPYSAYSNNEEFAPIFYGTPKKSR